MYVASIYMGEHRIGKVAITDRKTRDRIKRFVANRAKYNKNGKITKYVDQMYSLCNLLKLGFARETMHVLITERHDEDNVIFGDMIKPLSQRRKKTKDETEEEQAD